MDFMSSTKNASSTIRLQISIMVARTGTGIVRSVVNFFGSGSFSGQENSDHGPAQENPRNPDLYRIQNSRMSQPEWGGVE